MSAITAKASQKMKKYAVLTREPRCFLGSFDFSWEQRKLGELALFNPKDELPQTFEYVDLESVVGTEMLSHRTEVKSSAPSRAQRLAHTGDLFYQTVRPYQKNNYLYEKPDNNYVFSTGHAQMRPYVDGYFLLSLVQSERFVKVVLDNCTGTSYPAINANDLAEIEVAAPSDESEAQKIGTIFRSIDNLITLHQRKCALLFSSLQALISMIFTTSTFSWEQRKVQDVADRFDNLRIPVAANLRVHGTTPYYGANGIQDYVEGFTHDGEFVLVAEDGANDLKNYPVKCVNGRIWVNNHAHVLQGKAGIADNSFLAFAISQSDIESLLVGGGRAKLNAETLMSIEFRLPCLQEQYRIGEYLTQLDHLITLHQRECISFAGRAGRLILTANKKRTTSSWEQSKFSDITFPAGEKNKDNLPLESYSITNEHGFVPQDEKFENGGTMREADKRMYYIVSPNSFAYNPARINVGSIGYQNVGENVIVSSLYEVFKTSEDVDDRLLWHWFKSPDFQKLIMQLQEGGVRLYFYYDKLCMGEVSLPSLEEQRKIGKLFDTLDNLITLHQRKPFLMKWRTSDANRNQTNRLVL